MVDLFFLKTFVTAARKNSFRIAAERNNITQPAVSQQIRTLERQFQCKLFQRQGPSVSLTRAGEILLPYAENILHQYGEAQLRIENIETQYIGTLRIATIYSIGLFDLQPLIRRYLSKHPKVGVKLEYDQNQRIYEMLLNQKIDFGFVAYPKNVPGIDTHLFKSTDLVCVQSTLKPVFTKKTLTLKDLHQQPFVTFSAQIPTGKAIDAYLKSKHIDPHFVQGYQNIETLKSATLVGMGFSIVPKSTIQRELKNRDLEILTVKDMKISRPLGILMTKNKDLTKSMRGFLSMFGYRPTK